MSDATYIELPPEQKKRPVFWKSWRWLLLLLVILCVAVAGYFSWWLSEGKVSSAYARVDTTVYTVEATFPTTIEQLLVREGQEVAAGQPLARIDARAFAESLKESGQNLANFQEQGRDDIASRLNAAEASEKKMAARVAQARAEEDRYQKFYQNRVTEHVRAQLAMRAQESSSRATWEMASRAELAARMRMEAARDEFEKVSKMRAALDAELTRIRAELLRKKRSGTLPPAPKPDLKQQEAMALASTLYAPVQGKIAGINGQPGTPVNRGETVFLIMPTSEPTPNKWIQAWFPADARKTLEVGQKALVRVSNAHVNGTVAVIGTQAGNLPLEGGAGNAQYVPVQIQVQDQRELDSLAPGSRVDCQIQTRYLLGETYFF